jgi:hypothetical protein
MAAELTELVSVLTPVGTKAKVSALASRLGEATGLRPNQSDVVRAAIERGLVVLSMALGAEEDDNGSR